MMCDRCGREAAPEHGILPPGWATVSITTSSRTDGFDICDRCAEVVRRDLGHAAGKEITVIVPST